MNKKLIIAMTMIAGMLISTHAQAGGKCPQPRKTKAAPANIAKLAIPGSADVAAGKKLYQKSAKPMACKMCHGDKGDGNGKLGKALKPNPRNFTCQDTMADVSPGQMFWIIKNGSKGTGMTAHGKSLSDKDIWNVVKYIRADFLKE
ncbi:MAG: cytochrome c [Candidatus Nitronauta litoralis]|mgnify:FL=1|uniref:Cytochrome c n=1 Tax=Candidatus Nitronauta litoralis TaxID=2705533 RepID=A0A7T0FZ77_9BACT|nr:MAG: cytochrome c [Candidatus Nitronauta litoralis]